jgi:hypothetical protein
MSLAGTPLCQPTPATSMWLSSTMVCVAECMCLSFVASSSRLRRVSVALGNPAVPLILREIEQELQLSWFAVLAAITGENPVPPAHAGRLEAMARAWLDWAD